jgi:F0F1-type ATP synthase membrane subunit b/b'
MLRQEAAREKEDLIKELRETLEQTGFHAQMQKQAENAEAMRSILLRVPTSFYIG